MTATIHCGSPTKSMLRSPSTATAAIIACSGRSTFLRANYALSLNACAAPARRTSQSSRPAALTEWPHRKKLRNTLSSLRRCRAFCLQHFLPGSEGDRHRSPVPRSGSPLKEGIDSNATSPPAVHGGMHRTQFIEKKKNKRVVPYRERHTTSPVQPALTRAKPAKGNFPECLTGHAHARLRRCRACSHGDRARPSFPIARSRHARAASHGLLTHGILPTKSTTIAATPCPHFAALVAAPSPIAVAHSNCSPLPATAAPRRCYERMAFRSGRYSTLWARASRLRTASA